MERKEEVLSLINMLRDKLYRQLEDVRFKPVETFLENHKEITKTKDTLDIYVKELKSLEA